MNAIVEKGGNQLAAIAGLKGKLQKAKSQLPEPGGSEFLRLLTDGNWVFGQANDEIEAGTKVAFNTLSIKTGWSCWTDRPGKSAQNENLGEVMVPLGGDGVPVTELPKKYDPEDTDVLCAWREQISVDVKIMEGPHRGKQVLYKTTSAGGIGALNALIDQIMLQLDEDPTNCVPVVKLDSDHYNHKKWGRTYTPLLKIVDWMSLSGPGAKAELEDQTEDEDEDEDDQTEDTGAEEGDASDDRTSEGSEASDGAEPQRRRRRR